MSRVFYLRDLLVHTLIASVVGFCWIVFLYLFLELVMEVIHG